MQFSYKKETKTKKRCCSYIFLLYILSFGSYSLSRPSLLTTIVLLLFCKCSQSFSVIHNLQCSHWVDNMFVAMKNLKWHLQCYVDLVLVWRKEDNQREDNQNCSVLCCVRQLCTVIRTLRWAVLTVLRIGFCHAGSILLCTDLFVYILCVFVSCCIYVVLLWARWGGPDEVES